MSIKEFLELLNQDSRGRSWLLTLTYCLSENMCTAIEAKASLMGAINKLDESVSAGHACSPSLCWQCLNLVIVTTEIELTRNELRNKNEAYEFSHITSLDAARAYHFPILNKIIGGTTTLSPQTDPSTRLELVKEFLDKIQKNADLKPYAESKTAFKRLWLGQEKTDITKPLEAGMIALDKRGLVHLEVNDFLLEYQINPNEVALTVRPTSLDGVGKRFRSWGDADTHEPFGTTVHLAKLAQNESNIDGVAECITPAMYLTNSFVRKVSALGHPIKTRGLDTSDNDDAYASRLEKNLASRNLNVNKFLQTLY